ncbi:MAG: ABC transporter permease [Imperialibacter sp.]|uniref:ABC transporter permease n=1 Tax=Imperialibacter sp. TaxID=2038411 RepID=UPI003A8A2D67
MLGRNLIIAWRHIRKDKVTTGINLFGLVIGVTACLLTYLIILAELSYDTFHEDRNSIFRVVSSLQMPSAQVQPVAHIPYPVTDIIRNEFDSVESVATFISFYGKVAIPFEEQELIVSELPDINEDISDIILAQPSYFAIFQYEWLAGEKDSALLKPFQLVLTESKARRYFGGIPASKIIGREVVYNDSLRTTVVGVVKDWEQNTDFIFNDFISFETLNKTNLGRRIHFNSWQLPNRFSQTFVKLKKAASVTSIEHRLTTLMDQHPEANISSVRLQPLTGIHFDETYRDMYSGKARLPVLYTLNAIALFILGLAVINYINLSTAQSFSGTKEVGIRRVLGSRRSALIFQSLLETFLLTSLAVALALLLVEPGLALIASFVPKKIGLHLLTPLTSLGLLGMTLIISLLAGFYPALVATSSSPLVSLGKHKVPTRSKKISFGKVLIVIQFTISIVLINCSLVINKQIVFLLTEDPGVNQHNIVNFNIPGVGNPPEVEEIYNKLKESTAVKMVSRNMGPPLEKDHRSVILTTVDQKSSVQAELLSGDENYIELFEIKMTAGRNFEVKNRDSLTEFLLNESAILALGFDNPDDALGKHVACDLGVGVGGGRKEGPIVGIVADFHSRPLKDPINPVFFIPSNRNSRTISIKVSDINSSDEYDDIIRQLTDIWQEQYPEMNFRYSLLEREVFSYYDREFETAQIIGAATVISIFVSCIGLFGLSTFSTQLRTKEIGIRKVVGASVTSIVMMLSREFLILISIAIVFASPIAWVVMNTWLKIYAYHTSFPLSAFVIAGILALTISLLTIASHAIRVARKNPVNSLRFE